MRTARDRALHQTCPRGFASTLSSRPVFPLLLVFVVHARPREPVRPYSRYPLSLSRWSVSTGFLRQPLSPPHLWENQHLQRILSIERLCFSREDTC